MSSRVSSVDGSIRRIVKKASVCPSHKIDHMLTFFLVESIQQGSWLQIGNSWQFSTSFTKVQAGSLVCTHRLITTGYRVDTQRWQSGGRWQSKQQSFTNLQNPGISQYLQIRKYRNQWNSLKQSNHKQSTEKSLNHNTNGPRRLVEN